MRFQGWDLSPAHGAAVEIEDGRLSWWAYYTPRAGVAARSKNGTRSPDPKKNDERQAFHAMRLVWIRDWIANVALARSPDFVGLEDYALHAAYRAHQIGEIGGAAKTLLWDRGVPYRLHDPTSVKMFATHNGNATKDVVEDHVKSRWGVDFSEVNALPARTGAKQLRESSEDLADAFAIAKLVEVEQAIRTGKLRLDQLEHDKERQVFNRTTSVYPVSLLGREWIQNPRPVPDARALLRLQMAFDRAKGAASRAFLAKILKG